MQLPNEHRATFDTFLLDAITQSERTQRIAALFTVAPLSQSTSAHRAESVAPRLYLSRVLAQDRFHLSVPMRIVVVGAGCFGLSSAIRLLQAGYQSVVVLSRHRTPHTTSDGAGALWRPVIDADDVMAPLYDRWGQRTLTVLAAILRDFGHIATGSSWVNGYEFGNESLPVPLFAQYIPGFRKVAQDELQQLNIPGTYAFNYNSIIADMTTYLPFLHRQFEQLGGEYIEGEIDSFSPPYSHSSPALSTLLSSAELIVNCTGLAPSKLLNDSHMRPVRGYLVRVSAPFLHHWLYSNDTKAYLFPRHRDCVLGGTFDVGCSDTNTSETVRDDVLERCAAVVPDIKSCRILNEWVGLRPWRDMLRLELEWPSGTVELLEAESRQRLDVQAAGCAVPVIHNYGAGGSGMTIHWGCAEEVVQLARRVAAPHDSAKIDHGKEHGFTPSLPKSL